MCWNTSFRRGFTLVEVIAGVLVMGALLVGVLISYGRLAKQIKRAAERLEGIEAAEVVLRSWNGGQGWGPSEREGEIANFSGWRWRYDTYVAPELVHMDASVGRLQVFRADTSPDDEDAVRITVEVLANGVSFGQDVARPAY